MIKYKIIFFEFFFILLTINILIKSQSLTNIIRIGDNGFSYVNIANFSNGDIVIETTSNKGNAKRIFYGLKNNGEYFFHKKGKSTLFYSMNSELNDNSIYSKNESEIFTIKVNDTNKEYLVSVSKKEQYCELYDFDSNNIYKVKSSIFLGVEMTSIRQSSSDFIINGENYIIFPFLSNNILKVIKIMIKSKDIEDIENNVEIKEQYTYDFGELIVGNSVSCFKADEFDIIICFILNKYSSYSSYSVFSIIVLDKELKKKTSETFQINSFYQNSFYKCIKWRNNVGAFFYYQLNNNKNKIFPYFSLRYYKQSTNEVLYYNSNSYQDIEINYKDTQFNIDSSLNDIVKLNEKKICFSTISENKEILYIILINLYQGYLNIRYYPIEIFNLYGYKFFSEIRFFL